MESRLELGSLQAMGIVNPTGERVKWWHLITKDELGEDTIKDRM